MFGVNCLWLFVSLGCCLALAEGATKTWKYTNDIMNPLNWEDGKPANNCKGVIFPEDLGSVGSVFELFADEVVLPIHGELEIRQGGFIEIAKDSPCLRIKELEHRHWLNPDSWNYGANKAIPDAEKVPCVYDDVVFSAEATVAVFYPEVTLSVNSIQIGGISPSNEQWQNFLQSDYGGEQFFNLDYQTTEIKISALDCADGRGCTCHNSDDVSYWVCDKVGKQDEAPCFEPIKPTGHCNPTCGGVVVVEVTERFRLTDFQKRIPKYDNVDSYASLVNRNGEPVVQVVFAEKDEYTELSTAAAKDFHSIISGDMSKFRVKAVTLEVSGVRLPKGSALKSAFSIIFGSFVGACLLYFLVYAVYIGPLAKYNFRSRVPFREISFRNLRPFLFARFENKEEGQLSMAASMVSLEKSFDNPMYGAHRLSTSSAAVHVVLTESQPSTSETTHENPAFSGMRSERVEIEDIEDED